MAPTRAAWLAMPAILLAGCNLPPPPQEPLLTLSRTDCDVRPDFGAALPVRLDASTTAADLGEGGRCLHVSTGAPTTYAAFALPDGTTPYTLDILSSVVSRTLVRPVATLYDAAGQPVRTVPPEEFETNIAGLRAGVRPRGTERWLVVTADQSRLGQEQQLRLGQADGRYQLAAAVIIPLVVVPPAVPDVVRQRSAVFAMNGRITVVATPVRTIR